MNTTWLKIAFATALLLTVSTVAADTDEYTLTKYVVDIEVGENNAFRITEHISANFKVPKHGIIREIPLRNKVVRLDGTKSYIRAKISDLRVDGDIFTAKNDFGSRVIQIGNPDKTVIGNRDYIITYLYDIGRDRGEGYDEFYFNIIGSEWDTSIGGIAFTITMPKAFDASRAGFSYGLLDATDSRNITWQADGNTITGSYDGTLREGEALTVRIELPEGYFSVAADSFDFLANYPIILSAVFFIIVFGMWFVYGRDEKTVDPMEFYPPEGMNSAEVGFLYKGYANTDDAVSLLIYLAEKGYIQIIETTDKVLFTAVDNFKIKKLRDYDGDNPNERLFMYGLFRPLSGIIREEVTINDLKIGFHLTIKEIVDNLGAKTNRETIFEKSSLNKSLPVFLMMAVIFVTITLRPVLDYHEPSMLVGALLFPGVGFAFFLFMLFSKKTQTIIVNGKPKTSRKANIQFGVMFGLFFGGMPWAFIVLPALLVDTAYWVTYSFGMICIVGMFILNRYMWKRTELGNKLLGRIRGFRNFLVTAEWHKLETLVMQNPTYFYNILPFTYVLGVSDKWIKKFETIAVCAPGWYVGKGTFSMVSFGKFMDSTMKSATKVMSPPPSGRSGGGSSGRGSGGGGGRSW